MAYEYGAIQPNVSPSATERERIEARRAFGLSKASYLSQMDQFYAGIEAQKETREDTQAHEKEMFDLESPFKWEQLRLQEKGIDVGAETQRYGVDVGASTARAGQKVQQSGYDIQRELGLGELGHKQDWLSAQTKQADIGNYFYQQEMQEEYGEDWGSGWSYEDLGGGDDDDYSSYIIDEWGNDISGSWNADW